MFVGLDSSNDHITFRFIQNLDPPVWDTTKEINYMPEVPWGFGRGFDVYKLRFQEAFYNYSRVKINLAMISHLQILQTMGKFKWRWFITI